MSSSPRSDSPRARLDPGPRRVRVFFGPAAVATARRYLLHVASG